MSDTDVRDLINDNDVSEYTIGVDAEYAFLDWATGIFDFMDRTGHTQKDIAEAISRTPGRVSQILNDDSATNLTLGTMSRISRACGMRVRISLEDVCSDERPSGWVTRPVTGAHLTVEFHDADAA